MQQTNKIHEYNLPYFSFRAVKQDEGCQLVNSRNNNTVEELAQKTDRPKKNNLLKKKNAKL